MYVRMRTYVHTDVLRYGPHAGMRACMHALYVGIDIEPLCHPGPHKARMHCMYVLVRTVRRTCSYVRTTYMLEPHSLPVLFGRAHARIRAHSYVHTYVFVPAVDLLIVLLQIMVTFSKL